MHPQPNRRGCNLVQRANARRDASEQAILAAMQQAGALGLSFKELAEALGRSASTQLHVSMSRLEQAGLLFSLRRHPAVVHYHASVNPADAALHFPARADALIAKRSKCRRQTLDGSAAPRHHAPRAPRAARAHRPSGRHSTLPAVDPNGLRADAIVTIPPHVQVQVCPHGQDTRFTAPPGHKGSLSLLPLGTYAEPPSAWVQTHLQDKRAA